MKGICILRHQNYKDNTCLYFLYQVSCLEHIFSVILDIFSLLLSIQHADSVSVVDDSLNISMQWGCSTKSNSTWYLIN